MAVDPHVASALNRLLASPLRVEIDEVAMEQGSLANLTALAREIQGSLDDLRGVASGKTVGCASCDTLGPRRDDEQADSVIVV